MDTLISVVVAGLLVGSVYGLLSAGLVLEFGVMRVINFAHGFLVMLAMYLAALLWQTWNLNPYIAALLLMPAGFVAGALAYWGVLRPFLRRGAQPVVVALVTLALAVVIEETIVARSGARPRSVRTGLSTTGWEILGIHVSGPRLVAALIAIAVLSGVAALLRYTRWGRQARAVAQDPEAARTLGIDPERVSIIAFGVGTMLAAIAGCALVTYLPATPNAGLTYTLIAFVIVVLGGLSSFRGAWLAALVIGVISSAVGYYWNPNMQTPTYLVVFVTVLAIRPQGLFGTKGDLGEIHA